MNILIADDFYYYIEGMKLELNEYKNVNILEA